MPRATPSLAELHASIAAATDSVLAVPPTLRETLAHMDTIRAGLGKITKAMSADTDGDRIRELTTIVDGLTYRVEGMKLDIRNATHRRALRELQIAVDNLGAALGAAPPRHVMQKRENAAARKRASRSGGGRRAR